MEANFKNYVALKGRLPWRQHYMYFDGPGAIAYNIFRRHGVKVHFGRQLQHSNEPYRLVFCHVRRKDAPEFESALAELPHTMAICGYANYEEFCTLWLNKFEEQWRKQNEKDSSCE